MVARQGASWSAADRASDTVKVGAHLLKVASDFDEQVMRGSPVEAVLAQLRGNPNYNPAFVTALQELKLEEAKNEVRWLTLAQLKSGMITHAGVHSKTGLLLLAKGQEITDSAIARLSSFASLFGVVEPISVTVPRTEQARVVTGPFPAADTFAAPALR
jgi:hypothetical protein